MLHEFLTANTPEIVARTRAKLLARTSGTPTAEELKNGVPHFLSQLIDRLRRITVDSGAIEESATSHGGEMLAAGFSVSQVVHGYGDICQIITQLADERDAEISIEEFHMFNGCLDDAIANAVSAYEQRRDEAIAREGAERLGTLAHELRNRLGTALLSYGILKDGTVAIGGSTGAVLGRSLRGLRDLVNNALAGVRLDSGVGQRQRVSVSEIVEEVEVEAGLEAKAGGFGLAVSNVAPGVDVQADPQILAAAIGNLLQNAFKFSGTHGQISLRASATADQVVIEIEDTCGGLPQGAAEDLFHPFEQRSSKRSGLGLGLGISRRGVEAMGGTIGIRDLPSKGCIFSIQLPLLPSAARPS